MFFLLEYRQRSIENWFLKNIEFHFELNKSFVTSRIQEINNKVIARLILIHNKKKDIFNAQWDFFLDMFIPWLAFVQFRSCSQS